MELALITGLLIKHFICDYPLQKWSYQYANKGTYGHPGGLLHAGIHGIGTWLVFAFVNPVSALGFALVDAAVHYHVDWLKMNLNAKYKWTPNNNNFWILLGADQLLHQLTYIALVWWATKGIAA